jgi:hypothetical protein
VHGLDVWIETTLGTTVRVGNGVAKAWAFATDVTYSSHFDSLKIDGFAWLSLARLPANAQKFQFGLN